MKERMPFVVDIVIGVVLIAVGLVMRVEYYNTMVFAAGVGLVSAGTVHLARVIYWQAPQRQAAYQARKQEAHINAVDSVGHRRGGVPHFGKADVKEAQEYEKVERWLGCRSGCASDDGGSRAAWTD